MLITFDTYPCQWDPLFMYQV